MADSIPNYGDLADMGISDTTYTGLTDTAESFTGSSTLQDVQLGSPVQLDTSYGLTDMSVLDGLSITDPANTQNLAGTSDTPIGSASISSPTPNVTDMSSGSSLGLSALSKFGASLAGLFAPNVSHVATPPQTSTPGGAAVTSNFAKSGSATLVFVILAGALMLLLLRSED